MSSPKKPGIYDRLAQIKQSLPPSFAYLIDDLQGSVETEVKKWRDLAVEADRNLSQMAEQLPALTRRIDVCLNGEAGAARAPLLIDVLGQLEKVRADGGGLPLMVQIQNLTEALAREVDSPTHMGEPVMPPMELAEQMLRDARDAWRADPQTSGVMPDHQITIRVIAAALSAGSRPAGAGHFYTDATVGINDNTYHARFYGQTKPESELLAVAFARIGLCGDEPKPASTEQFVGERITVDKALWEMLWKSDERYRYLRDDAQWSDDPFGPQVVDMREQSQGHRPGILAEEDLDEAIDAAIAAKAADEEGGEG